MKIEERIERIKYLEKNYDECLAKIKKLKADVEDFKTIYPKIADLEKYYEDGSFQEDYKLDEEGMIPQDLKRGILSEDAIYDLLMDFDQIKEIIKELNECL